MSMESESTPGGVGGRLVADLPSDGAVDGIPYPGRAIVEIVIVSVEAVPGCVVGFKELLEVTLLGWS